MNYDYPVLCYIDEPSDKLCPFVSDSKAYLSFKWPVHKAGRVIQVRRPIFCLRLLAATLVILGTQFGPLDHYPTLARLMCLGSLRNRANDVNCAVATRSNILARRRHSPLPLATGDFVNLGSAGETQEVHATDCAQRLWTMQQCGVVAILSQTQRVWITDTEKMYHDEVCTPITH